ncbi:MAG: ribose 5-phosphate isomerase B [Saprospiraceae bacterium]|jgi:ribose 5-phosphate isomerase B|tara:strand:+ start:1033 stop:1464 length:432 start_codon:yes stop_codon:yes gene_type:complete
MKVAIGCDHAGFDYKDTIIRVLKKAGYEVIDKGTYSTDSVDYPDFVHPVANLVEKGDVDFGVLICGSGNGVSMSANKHKGVRAALCWKNEIASLARQHNDANIISIPARFVSAKLARQMVRTFISTEFEGGRHLRRVNKISMC